MAAAYLIASTGFGQADDRRLGREAGFDHHLVRSPEYAALMAALTAFPREG